MTEQEATELEQGRVYLIDYESDRFDFESLQTFAGYEIVSGDRTCVVASFKDLKEGDVMNALIFTGMTIIDWDVDMVFKRLTPREVLDWSEKQRKKVFPDAK